MSWTRVADWLTELSRIDPAALDGLGGGGHLVWLDTLARVRAGLPAAQAQLGQPYAQAAFVAARTVPTAAIEWCALLLGHGTAVTLKHPAGEPATAPLLVAAARAVGLPLSATDDRAAVHRAELVIAMGSDETMDALRRSLPSDTDTVLFGHRFSAAWVPADTPDGWEAVAEAVWPYDSRGCLSPQVVLSPSPLSRAVPALGDALAAVQERLPRGPIGPGEAARIRARGALARVLGVEAHGPGWAVHGLPVERWHPEALARCAAVVSVADRTAAAAALAPWSRWLSTVGDDGLRPWAGASRVCAVREMQRPPLDRVHDGVPVLRAVLRP